MLDIVRGTLPAVDLGIENTLFGVLVVTERIDERRDQFQRSPAVRGDIPCIHPAVIIIVVAVVIAAGT